uniref:Hermansky-Pudlak syndrome 6 protein homolog n=1 Tax=Cyprinus carpio carpio TaxID=630221 RepID=A0A8C1AA69_CYPCA
MTRLSLEQVTDFGDFTKGKDLKEFFKQAYSNISSQNCLSDVRLSPDGRHIHVIVREPKSGLMTYDKYQRPHLIQCQKHNDLVLSGNVPVVDVIYVPQSKPEDGASVLGVIFENGRVEFWKFLECRSGWHLLQTVDLCNSPRAKVSSVCMGQNFIIWCEERPPSENSNSVCSNFRFCICKKTIEVHEGGVSLGNVKIALHNNPRYTTVSSGDLVYLLPDMRENSSMGVLKVFLAWSPEHDTFKVHSACSCTIMKSSSKESDFKRLVADCIGLLSTINPSDICGFSPTGCGDLLLLLSTGWVCIIKRDGSLHHIYKLPDNCLSASGTQNSLKIYNEILALTIGKTLFLIDTKCGLELERISLKTEGLLFINTLDSHSPQMLSETGLFVVTQKPKPSPTLSEDSSALLVEAVFEEACKYYQQRSLSSTQLTVEKLKKGGMFQAPISLAAILRDYLSNQKIKTAVLHLRSNGEGLLSSKVPVELWKIILSPVQPTANFAHCNGQQKHTTVPVFELLCQSIFKFQPSWLPRFLELAQQQSGGSSKSSWGYSMKESSESLPLYKRALTVLPCKGTYQHLEVELLLCSERPKAIMQALRILIKQSQWEQVAQVAERFCRQSPLLNKEIFIALLCEVSQHRDLDPYLDLLWTLCPEDMTVTSILNIVLKNLPDSVQNSDPFEAHGRQVTIGLLKPLLRKVLQRETKPSQRYADILQSPTVPPLTPPRQPKGLFRYSEQQETKQSTSSGSQVTSQAKLL